MGGGVDEDPDRGPHAARAQPGPHRDVQVGIQVRREPAEVVPADVEEATWEVEVSESYGSDARDFHGPAVQGKRGERFVYLTWLEGPDATMFRRLELYDLGPSPFPRCAARPRRRLSSTSVSASAWASVYAELHRRAGSTRSATCRRVTYRVEFRTRRPSFKLPLRGVEQQGFP